MDRSWKLVALSWLVLFLGLMIVRALALWLTQRINVLTLSKGKKGLAWWAELLFVPMLLAWIAETLLIGLGSNFRLFPTALEQPILDFMPLKLAGTACLFASLALFAWALVSFGRSWRIGIDEKKPGELITRGAFAFSRNPIFMCMILSFIGMFLLHSTPILLLFTVIFTMGVHYQVKQEEQFLRQRYGEAYAAYCRLTPRYFSFRRPQVA